MAKRKAWLHIDVAGLQGDVLTHTLVAHREALREAGFKVPVRDAGESERAWIEMLRLHKAYGMRRREVEGTWPDICRRAWKGRRVPLISVPGLGSALPDQVALVLHSLAGLKTHVVVTVPVATTPEHAHVLDVAISRWEARLKPGRLHRVHVSPGDWETAWRELAALAGAPALPLVEPDVSAAATHPRRQCAT